MISRELIVQFLLGKPILQYIPLYTSYTQSRNVRDTGNIHAFSYQKTSDVKNYNPSEQELDDLLQDTEVKDKESWKEDIAYLEMIKRSRLESLQRQSKLKKFVHQFMIVISIPIILFLPISKIRFQIQNKINRELYSQFYTPLPSNFITSEVAYKEDAVFGQALSSFKNRNYSIALKLFRSITPDSYNYSLAQFYSGICNMEQNRMEAALIHFGKTDENKIIYPYVNWNKCLCFVKLGIIKEAIPLLSEIKKSNNTYSAKADELLIQIKNNF
jgi:hypothetical protein